MPLLKPKPHYLGKFGKCWLTDVGESALNKNKKPGQIIQYFSALAKPRAGGNKKNRSNKRDCLPLIQCHGVFLLTGRA